MDRNSSHSDSVIDVDQKKTTNKSQVERFREAARELETDDREEAFDAKLKKVALATKGGGKLCPECGHEFRGNGWDGIDAHWKSKHDDIMPYAEAWPLIQAGKYKASA